MDGKGTGLALGLIVLEFATALLLFYLAWTRQDFQERGLGGVLGIFLLIAVLVAVILCFVSPNDRRPAAFILTFCGLILLPGGAFMIAQVFGFRMALNGPEAPSPWILLPYILVLGFVLIRMAGWATTLDPLPGVRPVTLSVLQEQMRNMADSPDVPFH